MFEVIKHSDGIDMEDLCGGAIFEAVELGVFEFIDRIFQASPDLVWSNNQNKRNPLQFAIECRQERIYSLIYRLDKTERNVIGNLADTSNSNMLHMAAMLSPLAKLDNISGAALQMQRELQWFKRSRGNGHHCEWLDATTCARGKELIPGLLRRMRAMEEDLKLIEEQKKEVEDKLKMVEREKKELEYKVGELGKQKRVLEENRMGQRPRENRIWGVSFLSMGLGFLVIMMMLCILSNWLTFPGGNSKKRMIN
ncbi:hypothetical protein ACE6H2_006854 [Prunus campanulata]